MEGVDYVEVVTRNCVPVDIIRRMEWWGMIEWVGGGRLYDSHFGETTLWWLSGVLVFVMVLI